MSLKLCASFQFRREKEVSGIARAICPGPQAGAFEFPHINEWTKRKGCNQSGHLRRRSSAVTSTRTTKTDQRRRHEIRPAETGSNQGRGDQSGQFLRMRATAQQSKWAHGQVYGKVPTEQPTEFEIVAGRLGLTTEAEMLESQSLKRWVKQYKDRRYVPERLLQKWQMTVSESSGWLYND